MDVDKADEHEGDVELFPRHLGDAVKPLLVQRVEDVQTVQRGDPQLFNLHREIIGPQEVGVTNGRTLIHALGQCAHLADARADLHAQQQPAGARFRALAHNNLEPVRAAQVIEVDPIPRRAHLVDEPL